jgi:N-acetylmuramic acid 6-phosphate etherase
MGLSGTEAVDARAQGLDLLAPVDALRILAEGQIAAANAVLPALPSIASAAEIAARTLQNGGRLVYAAAGSSGLMALADALELPGTFGIPLDRVTVLLAGGKQALIDLAGAPEDDGRSVVSDLTALDFGPGDCLIALSASGTTPYAVAALDHALELGAATIGIANNAGTPLVTRAGVGIVLATPPEILAGSTRMGAGTAQKIALNMMSTLMAIRLGHVHDGYMVNVLADNAKLRDRAHRMVSAIAGCDAGTARTALSTARGSVKPAVLVAAGAPGADAANALLAANGNRLRPALARLKEGSESSRTNRT